MGTRKPLSPALEFRIIALYQSGHKINRISSELGIHYQRIKNLLIARNIPLHSSKSDRIWTDAERAQITSLYPTTGLNKLCTRFHIGQDAIVKLLTEEGVSLRKPHELPNARPWKSIVAEHYHSIGLDHVAEIYEK